MPERKLSANFVPVIAIMFASKAIPALDTGGSQIPMLLSVRKTPWHPLFPDLIPTINQVLGVPRVLNYLEDEYAAQLENADNMLLYLITGIVSVGMYTLVVLAGKANGYFGPPGEDRLGTKATPVDKLEYIQGEPVDVHKKGQVKIVEFWATWCAPCKKVGFFPYKKSGECNTLNDHRK